MKNYCTHALEFFQNPRIDYAIRLRYPESYSTFQLLIGLLNDAQKFYLPDYGRVLGKTNRCDFRDLLHLPYSVCALEYECPEKLMTSQLAGVTESQYFPKRRIALCIDCSLADIPLAHREKGGIIVISLCEAKPDFWAPVPMGGLLCPDTVELGPDGNFAYDAIPLFPELVAEQHYTRTNAMVDLADEVMAAVDFMMTINCANVTKELVEPPRALNKKRTLNGKPPFFSYWTLNVFKEVPARSDPQGGTHASPRFHFRRGHIRRYASGKVRFIARMAVGDPHRGIVEKDYRLTKIAR